MPAPDIAGLCDDLAAEHADLDALVAPLDAGGWDRPTPAEGWAIRDQIHHLGWFDRNSVLAISRAPTALLRHVAHSGVRTRVFSYSLRGTSAPEGDVRVELDAPDGSTWTWGIDDARDRVRGAALDFCLVVTQRRHIADT